MGTRTGSGNDTEAKSKRGIKTKKKVIKSPKMKLDVGWG